MTLAYCAKTGALLGQFCHQTDAGHYRILIRGGAYIALHPGQVRLEVLP